MAPGRRIGTALLIGALALAACGGGDSDDGGASAVELATEDAATGDAAPAPDGLDIPEGMPLADGLIPELAAIPLPDGDLAFGVGDAYGEDVDPRQTAVQQVFFTVPSDEVARFYIDALPAAGLTLDEGNGSVTDPAAVQPDVPTRILFTTQDGIPGQLMIGPSAVAASQMNINLYRSGTR